MAASMGSVLLGAGTKGKRSSLRFSKVMLHQSSGGFRGNIQDAEIDMKEWKEVNEILFDLLGRYCGKTPEQVMKDATRDFWLSSQEAVNYGIIDDVILKKDTPKKKK
jgi:ATP-dependent Clp protease protease subunit